ncbi:TrbI/VirB10 family protein [Sphingopyxis indica]|uniref:Type IV secretion system protein VirB10 n=1 Tax=Sphingopyxis indica TaxID=436663 RepID=A0A239ISG8_9SPHN|nr:TrbI/VirB10 family protein [Sphingopyxis indica]SNS96138.1 type IV secretion system protein VirB10 [Sphingopyxis indica]
MSGPGGERAEAGEPVAGLPQDPAARPNTGEEPEAAPVTAPRPVHDGQAFRLRGDPPSVMRLSRKALASVGAVACLSIGGALVYALLPARHADAPNLVETESRNKADNVTAAPASYDKVPKLGQPLPGDLGRPILSAQQNGQPVPAPPMGTPAPQSVDPRIAAAEQARQRIVQERDTARTSRLFLGEAMSGARASAASAEQAMPPASVGIATNPAPAPTGKRGFMAVAADRSTASDERIAPPVSPYIVQAGSVIPAALITGIQSDLPGQIAAQVTQNVYDSPTGRILLIPQGSRLIGEYDSEVSAGQSRVLLAWDRLILPGGRSILLDRQPGADASGMAGIRDRVNYHWGSMLKAALISTLLGVGTELTTDSDDALVEALRYGTQDTINQTGRQVVQRQLGIPPTLTIRPGHVLHVIVTRDLVLEPPREEQ